MQEYSRAQVAQLARGPRTVFIIDNAVYDASAWLEEHPGGREVLQQAAGGDASECFWRVGHSDAARELRARYEVGRVPAAERRPERTQQPPPPPPPPAAPAWRAVLDAGTPPLLLLLAASLAYHYLL